MPSVNIVVPMAGAGSRFAMAGYKKPKPFIDVNGKPMIRRVLDNLYFEGAQFILIAQEEHLKSYPELVEELQAQYPVQFITLPGITEGATCTVLHARKWINNDTPLLIANSDQLVDMDIQEFVGDCLKRDLDGSILTFIDKHQDPKWSFARTNTQGLVEEVREKIVISEYATVGTYFFREGRYFVDASIDMIARNERVNNEFYVCPVYNYLIQDHHAIGIYNIAEEAMHGLGTPEDLNLYLDKQLCTV